VTSRCALGIYRAHYSLALRRASAASSPLERKALFAEARRIAEASVLRRNQIAALTDASAGHSESPAGASSERVRAA
jgi:hypothetical protein